MSSRGEICHRAKRFRESFVSGEIASVPGPDQTNPANLFPIETTMGDFVRKRRSAD
jgi:hypothetical protein